MLYVYAVLIGVLSGLTSGLFGVGGGIVMVPAMTLLLRMEIKQAIGTSLAIMVPSALMGAFRHWQLAHVNWKVALCVIPAAIALSFVGASLTKVLPAIALRRAFGGLLIVVGARLVLGR
ncbi:MAG: sulfite exporter TauE/SafE family protein [Verrucomicrobia bacterium]|nr:MAG: sulfite exporter TauE/SafE family protein [Verrucomicrobiota bacterium]